MSASETVAAPPMSALARAYTDRFLGFRITPLTRRRLRNFRANKRGFWSLWIFLALFGISLLAEFVANDRPLIVAHDGHLYFQVFVDYPETTFCAFVAKFGVRVTLRER